jgi:16S rRNA C967 or C1407 C5-methylase (RsmB/RsmF family)/NOL1/NOP2/fmu family ribosome biogenesis protein
VNQDFISLITKTLPESEVKLLLDSMLEPIGSSIRINRNKIQNIHVEHSNIPHCSDGFLLKERPLFTADPALHAGAYYVQESNSMWVGELVKHLNEKNPEGSVVLDLCGAPGGKSTHISSVLRQGDLLIANEVIQSRNAILYENLSKWGNANAVVTRADAKQFGQLNEVFDIVVCDAPCSGEGMFRKDETAVREWSLQNVQLCAERQQRIVHDIWKSLKPNGYLIYSTCTFNRSENEDNVNRFCKELNAKTVPVLLEGHENLYCLEENMYRCMPHRTLGEGFFFAVIQKNGNDIENDHADVIENQSKKDFAQYKKNQASKSGNKQKNKKEILTLPFEANDWDAFSGAEGTYALRTGAWFENNPTLLNTIPSIVHPGVAIGKIFNGEWKVEPSFDLGCGTLNLYPTVELDIEQAFKYYRREFLNVISGPKGTVGLRWNNLHLGTANSVKNGLNNLWPVGWRIRSEMQAKSIVY